MKKHNWFNDFTWDEDGNGNYTVTHRLTGRSVFVKTHVSSGNPYTIPSSGEMVYDYFGNYVPRRFSKIGVMEYLENDFHADPEKISDLAVVLSFKARRASSDAEKKALREKISHYYTVGQLSANEHGMLLRVLRREEA